MKVLLLTTCLFFISSHIIAQQLDASEVIALSKANGIENHKLLRQKGYSLEKRNIFESTYQERNEETGLITSVIIGQKHVLVKSPEEQNYSKLLKEFKGLGYETTEELSNTVPKKTILRQGKITVELLFFLGLGYNLKVTTKTN